jgi:hypothetical protein
MAEKSATVQKRETKLTGIQINPPDPSFDPLTASSAELEEYWLPPRPDDQKTPIAYGNWARAMASRPTYPSKTIGSGDLIELRKILRSVSGREHRAPRRLLMPAVRRALSFRHRRLSDNDITEESSGNWSGCVVWPRNFDDMALIQGRWIVPDTPVAKLGELFASSTWLGLDGFYPASRIMPQIGTAQFAFPFPLIGGEFDRQFAWWQVWRRGDDSIGLTMIPLDVGKGDRIYAQIQVIDPSTVSFFLKNESFNTAFAAYFFLDKSGVGYVPFERQTANWILERPLVKSDPSDPTVLRALPLAQFGEVSFTDCNAATSSPNGALYEFQLERAPLIRMNIWNDDALSDGLEEVPERAGRLAAAPERIGDDALKISCIESP